MIIRKGYSPEKRNSANLRFLHTPETVPTSEFTRNFGRYRMRAQREREESLAAYHSP